MKKKNTSSIKPTKTQATSHLGPWALHSKKIAKAKEIKHMSADEILAAATADQQDTHWDAIVAHAIQMGKGQ